VVSRHGHFTPAFDFGVKEVMKGNQLSVCMTWSLLFYFLASHIPPSCCRIDCAGLLVQTPLGIILPFWCRCCPIFFFLPGWPQMLITWAEMRIRLWMLLIISPCWEPIDWHWQFWLCAQRSLDRSALTGSLLLPQWDFVYLGAMLRVSAPGDGTSTTVSASVW